MPDEAEPPAVEYSIEINPSLGSVSSLLLRPRSADVIYLIGHGAGAGMRHEFLEAMAYALFRRDVATLRYQFPYMEAGRKFPNRQPELLQTVKSAASFARTLAPDLTLIAGGKSMGGRMTTLAASQSLLEMWPGWY